jgi:hypothetical protein
VHHALVQQVQLGAAREQVAVPPVDVVDADEQRGDDRFLARHLRLARRCGGVAEELAQPLLQRAVLLDLVRELAGVQHVVGDDADVLGRDDADARDGELLCHLIVGVTRRAEADPAALVQAQRGDTARDEPLPHQLAVEAVHVEDVMPADLVEQRERAFVLVEVLHALAVRVGDHLPERGLDVIVAVGDLTRELDLLDDVRRGLERLASEHAPGVRGVHLE